MSGLKPGPISEATANETTEANANARATARAEIRASATTKARIRFPSGRTERKAIKQKLK
jgi:hypothetical protein